MQCPDCVGYNRAARRYYETLKFLQSFVNAVVLIGFAGSVVNFYVQNLHHLCSIDEVKREQLYHDYHAKAPAETLDEALLGPDNRDQGMQECTSRDDSAIAIERLGSGTSSHDYHAFE